MTVASALSFIRRALVDNGFRKKLNYSQTSGDLSNVLEEEKFSFSYPEFEEAFYMWLVKCQEAEDADQLKELQAWWAMLNRMLADQDSGETINAG